MDIFTNKIRGRNVREQNQITDKENTYRLGLIEVTKAKYFFDCSDGE